MSILNRHIVNGNGRGSDKNRETFHALRRTTEGLLFYTKRDKNVGTFSNDNGTTLIANEDDYVSVVEEYITSQDQTFTGDGTDTTFVLTVPTISADRLAIFVDRARQIADTDYTYSGSTITFTRAPHNNAEIFVRKIKKEYKNESTDTFQQYRFENGDAYYNIDSNGKLKKVENKRVPLPSTTLTFSNVEANNYAVNSTTYTYQG